MADLVQNSLLDQMQIDDLEIQRRKELLGLAPADEQLLARSRPFILQRLEQIVNDFYEQQMAIDEIALIIGDHETLQRLHATQEKYVASLFSGCYDRDYVNDRLRIGLVHKRIGVEPKLYLSATRSLQQILRTTLSEGILNEDERASTLYALEKIFFFDIEFVFDTYIRSLLSELEAAKDQAVQYAAVLEERVAERTRELERLSRSDPLTNLLNRRAFREELRRELARTDRYAEKLSLLYLDVDNFKQINDLEGHRQGDIILKSIGRMLLEIKREADLVARYGGDEFCVALPDTTQEGAQHFARRLEEELSRIHGELVLSVGIAQIGDGHRMDMDDLLHLADRDMYRVKQGHRAKDRDQPQAGYPGVFDLEDGPQVEARLEDNLE